MTEKEEKNSHKHHEDDHKSSVKYANTFALYALGFTIVIGGQVFSWNVSLQAGVWEAFAGFLLTSVGYICLVLCLAEMTSALPFSGGSYGFVRVCVGPFFGYCIGCCEALQNIAYTISAVIPFARMLTTVFNEDIHYEPAYWTLFFVVAMGINIAGGKIFWYFNNAIGMISLALVIIYIVSTAQYCDFSRYAEPSYSSFNGRAFVKYFPLSSWFFLGVESIPLACVDCEKPSSQIPWAMVACVLTLFLTGIGVFFTSVSQAPGIEEVGDSLLPLNFGYNRVFGMSHTTSTWLAIPATFATGFGFMFVYGRQMNSMARSGLFPEIFKNRTSVTKTPYSALIFGSVLAIIGVILVDSYDQTVLLDVIYHICTIASFTIYVFVFWSYIVFFERYSNVPRAFKNPFGRISAVIGLLIFLFALVAVLGFQNDRVTPITVFMVFVSLLVVYYYFFGFHTQKLSEEEHKALFKAYVINANKIKKRSAPTSSTAHSSYGKAKKALHGVVKSSPFLQYMFGSIAASDEGENPHRRSNLSDGSRNKSGASSTSHPHPPIHHENDGAATATVVDENLQQMMMGESVQNDSNNAGVISHALFAPSSSTIVPAPGNSNMTMATPIPEENPTDSKFPAAATLSSQHRDVEVGPSHYSQKENGSHRSATTIEHKDSDSLHHQQQQQHSHHPDHPSTPSRHQTLRASFLGSISEKVMEIANEIKLIPLMNEQERNEYESVVLAEYRGELQVVEDEMIHPANNQVLPI